MIKITDHSIVENSLIQKILKITAKMQLEFPELSKYLNEVPVRNQSEMNSKPSLVSLSDYYNSLCSIYQLYKNNV